MSEPTVTFAVWELVVLFSFAIWLVFAAYMVGRVQEARQANHDLKIIIGTLEKLQKAISKEPSTNQEEQ